MRSSPFRLVVLGRVDVGVDIGEDVVDVVGAIARDLLAGFVELGIEGRPATFGVLELAQNAWTRSTAFARTSGRAIKTGAIPGRPKRRATHECPASSLICSA